MQKGTLDEKSARFLFHYRITPQTTTGISPAELFLGRKLRSRFDLLRPDLATKVGRKQDKQKESHDQHAVDRHFTIGQSVYVKNFARGPTWIQGKIVSQVGPVSFKVELTESQVICNRHQDHIRVRHDSDLTVADCQDVVTEPARSTDLPCLLPQDISVEAVPHNSAVPEVSQGYDPVENDTDDDRDIIVESQENTPCVLKNHPQRNRKPPDRFMWD